MTTAGWTIMTFGILGMTGLLAACLAKVLRNPASTEHLHSRADIDTHDT